MPDRHQIRAIYISYAGVLFAYYFFTSQGLTLIVGVLSRNQAKLGLKPQPALHGFRHTGRVV
jgi:hypothetical protein